MNIVSCSADVTEENINKCRDLTFDEMIKKPKIPVSVKISK